ncbi:unnamed protein product [Phytomonas sp. Hart1]|nr:unnamed protein product [Phytomonas sp. Hart1]|eukprot:CCW68531.1 unnamed protein product [Phytomonas sp. isolate Hart1]
MSENMSIPNNVGPDIHRVSPLPPSMPPGSFPVDQIFHSQISSSAGPSPSVTLLDDRKGLQPNEKLIFTNQMTNTGAVINFTEIIYSDSMRGYRVYRREHQVSPFFRLLSTNNMLLLAASLSLLLSCLVHTSASQFHLLHWLLLSDSADDTFVQSSPDFDSETHLKVFSLSKLKIMACVFFWLLFIMQLIRAYRSVYVEEVLAIRGIGLQFTSYGVFNRVREKRFVDRKLIRFIVIHDTFYRYQPIFFFLPRLRANRGDWCTSVRRCRVCPCSVIPSTEFAMCCTGRRNTGQVWPIFKP